ncbi:MAG: hypothetical protein B7Z74_03200 [Deltaproteobacteria bacterium 21-66-5]|nr:MAG: hypothetical protein B7Z74_03200 [Deltaproteobacteria bacterium 21-66-5]
MPEAAPAAADSGTRDLASVRPGDLDIPIARHQFSLGVVASSLALVLYAGTRLQRVAAVLAMHWSWSGLDGQVASYYSVRLWLLRLGLYQLNRPKTQADDWMWIVDHTVQLGEHKCLIIVAIRQSAWDAEDRVLSHEDVDLIDLVPVTESNGAVVFGQLKAAAAKTGVPRSITSDDGSDLHRGIALFREAYPSTTWLYDIKHKTACLLKHALDGDTSWQTFVAKVHHFKQQVTLTSLAGLAPPQQRSKARYMNVDVLVDWARESLLLLDCPKAMRKAGLDKTRVEEKLGWLRKFAPQVRRWGEMLAVIGTTEHYVRHEGIHGKAAEDLAALLPKPATPAACRLRKQLLEFVKAEGQQAREKERLLGSSEVLESILGKFKHLAGERGPHGLTGMVLSIGALVGKLAVETVQAALSETTTHQVGDWCRSNLGATVQSVRQKIRQALHPEQKQKLLPLKSG